MSRIGGLLVAIIIIAVLTSGCSSIPPSPTPSPTTPIVEPSSTPIATPSPTPASPLILEIVIINSAGNEIPVWVEEHKVMSDEFLRGLGEREILPENQGMLFDWEEDVTVPFYMKDTTISLSIAFISSSGEIVDIQDMEPLSTVPHAPPTPYRYALEVNRGFFEANSITVGDRIKLG